MDQGTMIDLQSPMFMDDVYNPSTRSNNVVLMWLQDKKGTTFYGLGDSRQMVIMMSLFSLCVTGPVLLVIIKIDFYIALDSIFSIFCALLPLLTAMCSLLGAVRYDPRLVAINVLWHICNFFSYLVHAVDIKELKDYYKERGEELPITSPWIFLVLLAIISTPFVYIQLVFIKEVSNGIMTIDTYPRERYLFLRPRTYVKFIEEEEDDDE